MRCVARRLSGRRLAVVALASLLTVAAGSLRSADFRPDYRPSAYAIRGARVVTGPDATIEAGTVIVRNGLIEAVGPAAKLAVPFDAEVIDGEGLVVYPGFLDL